MIDCANEPQTVEDYMQLALAQAALALREGEVAVGAIIVKKGTVLASAHNQVIARSDPTAHAEMLAIQQAAHVLGDWHLTECTLYVTVQPCAMCQGAIAHARIARVVYGANQAIHPPMPKMVGGICAQPCLALMQEVFKQKR